MLIIKIIQSMSHYASGPVNQSRQPGGQLGKKDNNPQPDELKKDKRNDAAINMAGRHIRRCHRF